MRTIYLPEFKELEPEFEELIAGYEKRMKLSPADRLGILADLQRAVIFLKSAGTDREEICRRLSPAKLGDFYMTPALSWYPLDFSAKIYPLSMKRDQMAIFRLSVYLKKPVVPELLQMAVTFTLKRFPFFAASVSKGFFWHHIDTVKRRFKISPDNGRPCVPMNISLSGTPALKVIYFGNRISVEFFHILTDGSGGMVFLKTLAAEYLRLTGAKIPAESGVFDISSEASADEFSNDFERFYKPGKSGGFVDKTAAQMGGRLARVRPCRVLHFDINSADLVSAAHSMNVSVTALVTAVLFCATKAALSSAHGKIQIQIPVNMRKFYPSETLRNFAMYCSIRLKPEEVTSPEEIVHEVARQLTENASEEEMTKMMRATVKLVTSLKYIPLFIKRPVAGVVYGFLGDKVLSNTLSNLGVVSLPREMEPYVEKFDFVLGTVITNRAACSLVSYGGHAVLSVEKLTADETFESSLSGLLENLGIGFSVTGSEYYGN